ncbi:MAG: glycosyltransferase family 2 protein [Burkholderiaceae bacterium]|nr:glycosyltransferase family 2 protein [Burkholderiaceae bacterium]
MPKISVVIPVFNEEDNVTGLIDQVGQALMPTGWDFELVLVDDGSRDATAQRMQAAAQQAPWLRCIFLIRNYGQSTALQAGFDHAQGDYIVTLDCDLQNDPADIPKLIDLLEKDSSIDCVSGWRKSRQDAAISRKIPSQIANALISKVTKVRLHDYGCALKAYRASIIKSLKLYGELHRFIPALAAEVGARIVEVPVNHRARTAGVSKYGIDRTIRVLLDLLWIRFTMRFLHRPIHAFGGVAAAMLSAGLLILAWLAAEKIFLGADIGGRPLLMLGVLLTLVGVQLLATGLIGELLVRIYHEPEGRRQYLLKPQSDSQWHSRAPSKD